MITFAEILQYEPIIFGFLLMGIIILILAGYLLIAKNRDGFDIAFSCFLIIMSIFCLGIFIWDVTEGYITHETITPCSISDQGSLVASVEGGMYIAHPVEMVKLHINQTREVVVLNGMIFQTMPEIQDVPGANCPSGAASRC